MGEGTGEVDGLEGDGQEVDSPSGSTVVESPTSIAASDEINSGNNSSEALGIALDLKKADVNLLAIIAFMLGFFNRLPLHILEVAAEKIFPNAYAEAYGKHAKKGKTKEAKNEIVHEHKIKAVVEYGGSKDRTQEEPSENEPSTDVGISADKPDTSADSNNGS